MTHFIVASFQWITLWENSSLNDDHLIFKVRNSFTFFVLIFNWLAVKELIFQFFSSTFKVLRANNLRNK